jgi:hypothetical protein
MRYCMWPNRGASGEDCPSLLAIGIYIRMNRWARHGVLDRVFAELQQQQIIRVQVAAVSLDSSAVNVHPDGTGALKKTGRKPLGNHGQGGPPRFIWLPQMLGRR